MGLVGSILIGGSSACAKATENKALIGCSSLLRAMLGLFTFCWFIAGNVWVFGNWSSVNFNHHMTDQTLTNQTLTNHTMVGHNEDNYCDQTAYMFSFVLLILAWVAVPIISVTCCLCWATIAACFN